MIKSLCMNNRSSSSDVCDELSVEQGVLLALVCGDEAHAGNNDQDEDDGEEELDQIRAVCCSGLAWLLKLYKGSTTLLLELACFDCARVFSSWRISFSSLMITLTKYPFDCCLVISC
jgi:hypothetical protein